MTEHVSASSVDSVAFFSLHDALTGLPNRTLLQARLDQALTLARRQNKHLALLSLDLNRFIQINQTLGRDSADQGLQMIGPFLAGLVRASDTVGYLGNNQFLILLTDLDSPDNALHVARKVRNAFFAALAFDEAALEDAMNIGISVFPQDGDDAIPLLEHAESSLAQFTAEPVMTAEPSRPTQSLQVSALQQALAQQEFVLHYQPQFDLSSCSIIGVEALIRWMNPGRGLICPHEFMPLAKEHDLMPPIGQWVLRETCRQINSWKTFGMTPLPLAINVSEEEFHHPDFTAWVRDIVQNAMMAPGEIELEISASTYMKDADQALITLHNLKDIGVNLAVDCFGIGMSSLRYLMGLPFDTVKVDRAFLINMESNPKDAVFLRSLISFGNTLNRRTIVMGVESSQQLAFLHDQHCTGVQGFQLGHPLPPDDFAMLLASRHCLLHESNVH